MEFCASIQCIDGRVVEPLQTFIHSECECNYIDTITMPGVDNVLAERSDAAAVDIIKRNLHASVTFHQTKLVFISAHFDCLANPVSEVQHIADLHECKRWLKSLHPAVDVRAVYMEEDGTGHYIQ